MFEVIDEILPGVRRLNLDRFGDTRGGFVKLFHAPMIAEAAGETHLREIFMSDSAAGVVRGMHFQVPPHDHVKLVTCSAGRVLDVVLDIRKGSPTYGRAAGVELDGARPELVVIPSGFAHGFAAVSDGAQMVYMTTAEHAPAHDRGILWNSFEFAWPDGAGRADDAVSGRDKAHPTLSDFQSPFTYEPGHD